MATAAAMTTSDVARMIPARSTIVAVTDDGSNPRHAAVRDAATEIAKVVGGLVLLHHTPPGASTPEARSPRLFVPDTRADGTGRPHNGSRKRDLLIDEAAAIRARGVDVAVWLSGQPGPAGIAEAIASTSAVLVLMPAESERRGVINLTLAYRATRIPGLVVAVGMDGTLALVHPLSRGQPQGADRVPATRRSSIISAVALTRSAVIGDAPGAAEGRSRGSGAGRAWGPGRRLGRDLAAGS
jgi:hypothetical protein